MTNIIANAVFALITVMWVLLTVMWVLVWMVVLPTVGLLWIVGWLS